MSSNIYLKQEEATAWKKRFCQFVLSKLIVSQIR